MNDLSNKVCVPNKTERFKSKRVYRKKRIKTLTKYISCGCKCRFDGRKCNLDQGKEKNRHVYEKRLRLEYCYM